MAHSRIITVSRYLYPACGPFALIDAYVVDQHLIGKVTRRDGTTQGPADRDVHDDVHRVIKRPIIVGRVGPLCVSQVGVIDITVNTDLDLIRGPPHLVGVPLINRGADVALPLKRCASVCLGLVGRAL